MKNVTPGKTAPDKRTQILHTAGAMFIEHGFSAVSMDALAEAVPVSKPTLYNHFDDKKALFLAVMRERCASAYQTFDDTLQDEGGPGAVLTRFGTAFLDLIMNDMSIGLYRLMVAEARSFPDLGTLFYEAGPSEVQKRLTRYLADMAAAGRLAVPEPARSAVLFIGMVQADFRTRALLGVAGRIGTAERQAAVAYAVEIFLKGHAI